MTLFFCTPPQISPENVEEQIDGYDTNKCESFHTSLQALNPKNKTNKSTYHARNFHAVTLDTKGPKEATKLLFSRVDLTVNSYMEKALTQQEKRVNYLKMRHKSNTVKKRRVFLRKFKNYLRVQSRLRSKKNVCKEKPAKQAVTSKTKKTKSTAKRNTNHHNVRPLGGHGGGSCLRAFSTTRSGRACRRPQHLDL